MKFIKLFSIIFLTAGFLYSQSKDKINYSLSHPIKYGTTEPRKINKFHSLASDTVNIIAVMVQFQEDNDPRTTGNGKMDLSNKYYNPGLQRDTVIDAPPYDSAYFADHLEFLKNYYYKSSKGKQIINYRLYGKLITLPHEMAYYSPQKNENFTKYGYLFNDTWSRADSIMNLSGYDSVNTAFVIFHAGVGKDINLESIFGYDPYPYDIPSVYLGPKNLQEIQINGFTTQSGFVIKNSMIIPSTELRELSLISGNFLLQLGINGILTASTGSYLGLPDLFDTKTGTTAIGRFGLMDGQSIFSFNGIFPPEPSAWEKIYLGWINPVIVSSGDAYYRLKTSSNSGINDTTIIKVMMSSKEYFLIENRNRSFDNSGQTVFTRNRAFRDSLKFTKDIPGFVNYDIYAVNGNITDVKYLDWSLPGAISDTCNFSGGVLIWHIDENIIDAKIGTNSINADIKNRGVKLMEAKGSQDIGVTYSTPFGDVTSDGYFVDFWYRGNHYVPADIYKNEFTPTSYPNSLSNSKANNGIYITEFDSIASVMKFRVKIGTDFLRPLAGFPKFVGKDNWDNQNRPMAFDINGDGKDEFFINNHYNLYGFKSDGNPISSDTGGVLVYNYGKMPASIVYSSKYGNSNKLALISNNYKIGFFGINNGIITDSTTENTHPSGITAYPLFFDSSKVVLGFGNGWIYEIKLDNSATIIDSSARSTPTFFSKVNNSRYVYRTAYDRHIITGNLLGQNTIDSLELVYTTSEFYINGKKLNVNYKITRAQSPILADVNKDGRQEIIFTSDEGLFAINSAGVLLENFPVSYNKRVSPGIVVGDINSDGIMDIVFTTTDGDLYAYGINGKLCSGYPVKTGANSVSTPALANLNDTLGIIIYGGDGYLYAYKTNTRYDENKILWKNFLKDKYLSNNNFKYLTSSNSFSEKLPSDRAYNWPNPVYDSKTFIRYYINGNATSATVKILDLSGEMVTLLNATAISNADNEIVWDVSNVQSGVYYGVIEAEIDGSKERKIIKIAVVK